MLIGSIKRLPILHHGWTKMIPGRPFMLAQLLNNGLIATAKWMKIGSSCQKPHNGFTLSWRLQEISEWCSIQVTLMVFCQPMGPRGGLNNWDGLKLANTKCGRPMDRSQASCKSTMAWTSSQWRALDTWHPSGQESQCKLLLQIGSIKKAHSLLLSERPC